MYDGLVMKTEAELAAMKAMRDNKQKIKEARRQHQQANIQKKESEKEKHKQKSLEGIRKKNLENGVEQPETQVSADKDDDVDYYRQEIGHMPDADTFITGGNKRKKPPTDKHVVKKRKIEKKDNVMHSVSKGKTDRSKGKTDRFSEDKNAMKSKKEGKTHLQIMMERKKKKKKMQEKKKNKFKGKKKKV